MTATGLRRRDLGLVLLICLFWATNFLTSAHALREVPPFLFTAMRMGLLAALLVAFMRVPPRAQWTRLFAVAMLNGVLHFGTSFLALKLAGDLSSPAIVTQVYVPMSVLLAWWLLGERFGWRTGVGVAISFAGVLVLGFDPMVLAQPAALFVMMGSSLMVAIGTVLMRGLKDVRMVDQQGWTAVLSLLPLLAISVVFEPGSIAALRDASAIAWGAAIYAAVFSSLLGHGVFYWLVQRHPVATVTPYLLLTPVLAVLLGILFWGDRPGPALWIGGAMVLGGVLVVALRAGVRQRALPPAEEL